MSCLLVGSPQRGWRRSTKLARALPRLRLRSPLRPNPSLLPIRITRIHWKVSMEGTPPALFILAPTQHLPVPASHPAYFAPDALPSNGLHYCACRSPFWCPVGTNEPSNKLTVRFYPEFYIRSNKIFRPMLACYGLTGSSGLCREAPCRGSSPVWTSHTGSQR
jgi:hypothetical protein